MNLIFAAFLLTQLIYAADRDRKKQSPNEFIINPSAINQTKPVEFKKGDHVFLSGLKTESYNSKVGIIMKRVEQDSVVKYEIEFEDGSESKRFPAKNVQAINEAVEFQVGDFVVVSTEEGRKVGAISNPVMVEGQLAYEMNFEDDLARIFENYFFNTQSADKEEAQPKRFLQKNLQRTKLQSGDYAVGSPGAEVGTIVKPVMEDGQLKYMLRFTSQYQTFLEQNVRAPTTEELSDKLLSQFSPKIRSTWHKDLDYIYGPDVDDTNQDEDDEEMKKLIRAGADVNYKWNDRLNITPLRRAIFDNNKNRVKIFLEAGAQVNEADDDDKQTPLHYAVKHGRCEIVQMLLDSGADQTKEDSEGRKAVDLLQESNQECTKMFDPKRSNKKNPDSLTAMWRAIYDNDKREVTILMKQMTNVNQRADGFNYTALHYAAKVGRTDIVKMLLDAGADRTMTDILGNTAENLASNKECKHAFDKNRLSNSEDMMQGLGSFMESMPGMKNLMGSNQGMGNMLESIQQGGGLEKIMESMQQGGEYQKMMESIQQGGGYQKMMQSMQQGGGFAKMMQSMQGGQNPILNDNYQGKNGGCQNM